MYKIVERDIGRSGNFTKFEKKKKEWDDKYGAGNWSMGYDFNGKFITRDEAIEQIYDPAYFKYLDEHPETVQELMNSFGVFNPHASFTNSSDIQSWTIKRYMNARGLEFKGTKFIPIGVYQPKTITYNIKLVIKNTDAIIHNGKICYPQISHDLSPYTIKCLHDPNLSVEEFWQSPAKCLGILINE